ncbi:hypothetical protein HY732_00220 [Candidatus Uhrbacteria bacterium]|nr:hypothetical protein [Candidatus Uhrbacteria bacterium]
MVCTLCSVAFTITEDDKGFYQKMDVPAPTLCPVCRFRRKAVWRNERTLYLRTCDLCKKTIVSMYPSATPYTVYCKACYYSDRWDPFAYGMRYDASRSFFEQFSELLTRIPKAATVIGAQSINSEYQNWAGTNRDCYMVFNSRENEMLMYSRGMRSCRDTTDCYFGNNVELCYESLNVHDSSRIRFGDNVRNCLDSWFLRDCTGCTDCFGCVNLRYKDYHFFNEPLTKEEYDRRVRDVIGSYTRLMEMKKKFASFGASLPFRENHNTNSEDCTGDYHSGSKSCYHSFEVDQGENCSYHYFTKSAKDSYDCIGFGVDSELTLESIAIGYSQRIRWCVFVENSTELDYCKNMRGCSSCIGCEGMEKAQFSILNTPYSEDEYRHLHTQIVESMKRDGSWGQFFPVLLAPFAFNESCAMDYYPLTKEEALAQGYRWCDTLPGTTGKETMPLENIPDQIRDVPDGITKEIFACSTCGRNYKITTQELALYRQMMVPVPRRCFGCRHEDRLRRRGPMELHEIACAKCAKIIQTTIPSDSGKQVYCEECYTAAVA